MTRKVQATYDGQTLDENWVFNDLWTSGRYGWHALTVWVDANDCEELVPHLTVNVRPLDSGFVVVCDNTKPPMVWSPRWLKRELYGDAPLWIANDCIVEHSTLVLISMLQDGYIRRVLSLNTRKEWDFGGKRWKANESCEFLEKIDGGLQEQG